VATLNRLVKTIFTGSYIQEEKNSAVKLRFMFSLRRYPFVGELRRTNQAAAGKSLACRLLGHATDFRQNYLPAIDPTATTDSSINPTSAPTAVDPTAASDRPSAIDPASGAGVWRRGKPGACTHCC
jgi:hypothetical protein